MARQFWQADVIENGVVFTIVSKHLELNYPGTVEMKATYVLEPKSEGQASLSLTMEAKHAGTEDEHHDCPINLTNHSYFNLAGHASGENILKHTL